MTAPSDLSHPAVTMVAETTLAGLAPLLDGAPWDSTIFLQDMAEPGPDTPALILRVDHRLLDADEFIETLRHDGQVYASALNTGDAQSVDQARVTHFQGSGHKPADFVTAFLYYLRNDAFLQPPP